MFDPHHGLNNVQPLQIPIISMNQEPRRKNSLRCKKYNYSFSGIYFITLCVHPKDRPKNIFGIIRDGKMKLNKKGQIAEKYWNKIPSYYKDVQL